MSVDPQSRRTNVEYLYGFRAVDRSGGLPQVRLTACPTGRAFESFSRARRRQGAARPAFGGCPERGSNDCNPDPATMWMRFRE